MTRVVVTLCLFLLAGCQTAPKPDRSTVTMGFAEATYGLGIEPAGRHAVISRDTLIRWERDEPIQLWIKGEPEGTEIYQSIVAELQALFQLAGLTLKTNRGVSKQVLRFNVRDESFLVSQEIKTRCYTSYDYLKDGYLRTVEIVATRESLLDNADNCLLHEGMHALGFAGHPHRLYSVLSYTQGLRELSEIDKRLIQMLYSSEIAKEMPLDDAVTVAYSQFVDFSDVREKRYVPTDLSLEIRENESPLIVSPSISSGLSKQFYYQTSKNGTRSTNANYGLRRSGQTFTGVTYIQLSGDRIFQRQHGIREFFESYESTLGQFEQVAEGDAMHSLARINYMLVESSQFSCVLVLRYINASNMDLGGHELIYGHYCSDISSPLSIADAEKFIDAIQVYDRDPVEIRKRQVATGQQAAQKFSALRMTGRWPVDDSYISGMKLVVQGQTEGQVKIRVNGEICNGQMSNIGTNGLGQWSLHCIENESAEGRFSWDTDGTVRFKGNTSQTGQEVDWNGYQVF